MLVGKGVLGVILGLMIVLGFIVRGKGSFMFINLVFYGVGR